MFNCISLLMDLFLLLKTGQGRLSLTGPILKGNS